MLRDRRSECESLDRLIHAVHAGESRALVLRGEAGVGKTALLGYVVDQAAGCRVVRAAGVQAEQEIAYAALHQVCAPLLDRLVGLPEPQQDALRTAFGLIAGHPRDRFVVGLAVLGLFAETARSRPLLCIIDDAQWLDRASAQVFAFVARRLQTESVAMIFAVRDSPSGLRGESESPELEHVAEMALSGLPDDDARALFVSAHPGPIDNRVLLRIVAETQGNPLALLELPRGLTQTELSGGLVSRGNAGISRRIEESYCRQLEPLSAQTRQLLLLAAAEPVGDPTLVWRAAEYFGIGVDAAQPAADLVDFGAHIRFRHPLVRSAVYRAASPEQRCSTHHALAQVTDAEADPDRRAWHRAQAASGPDEEVAAELERSAGRAQARGGLTAAAAFLERAFDLTPDPVQRGQRALAAAKATCQAGMPEKSFRLLSLADASPLDKLARAHADLLRAQIAFTVNWGGDSPTLLLKAAGQLEQLDAPLARETYLDALLAAWFAAPRAGGSGLRDVAQAARAAPAPEKSPRPADLLLDGLAVRFTEGFSAGAPRLKQALRAFRGPGLSDEEGLRWLWFATTTALDLFEDEAWEALSNRYVRLARDAGALGTLPLALTARITRHIFAGELTAAATLLQELDAVSEATGIQASPYGALMLAAWQGREVETAELVEATLRETAQRGEGIGPAVTAWMTALLSNSLGRYEDAMTAVRQSIPADEMGVVTWVSLVELVEAATRAGRHDDATTALERLSGLTRSSGTDWALGLEARCRALLSDGAVAEEAYREAIERLSRTRIRGELARAHLLYGEWLRRAGRRGQARDQLRSAHEMFSSMGMGAFADRAATELRATGETVHTHSVESASQLTAQEAQIARLAAEGLSNTEIATRLFISPRTVEWHMSKIFAKLQLTSRRQLRRAVSANL